MPKPDLTDITIVLDRSGSMASIATDVIGGINRFLEDQKAHPGRAYLTLVQFDHEYTPVHRAIPIGAVPPLDTSTYVPRGMTALLDAMGRSIVETGQRLAALPEAERPGLVVFVVQTDGLENSSKEYSRARINEMITHQRAAYSWQFLFLGANQDAIATAASMGIPAATAMTFAPDSLGVQAAYAASSRGVSRRRSGGMDPIYTESDRADQDRSKPK